MAAPAKPAPPPPCQWRPPANDAVGATVVSASTAAVARTALRPANFENRSNMPWTLLGTFNGASRQAHVFQYPHPMLGSPTPTEAERGCVIMTHPPLIRPSCSVLRVEATLPAKPTPNCTLPTR